MNGGRGQFRKWCKWISLSTLLAGTALWAAPFGRVVPLGGRAADLAIDEGRQVVYVSNFTANRIEVVGFDGTVRSSWAIAPQPSGLALSRDGQWLVVTHFANFAPPAQPRNALTVIHLETQARQTLALTAPPLGAAFGIDGRALVITAREFLTLHPATGTMEVLGAITDFTAQELPQPPGAGPPSIIGAAMAASGDGRWIYCLSENYPFRYEVSRRQMAALAFGSDPPLGPRTVSVNDDGGRYMAGWGLFDRRGTLLTQFPQPGGLLDVGSHAMDSRRGVIYAQVPQGSGLRSSNLPPPRLEVRDADNLALREQLELAENLAGRSLLSADGNTMYAISDSGLMVLPVGRLEEEPRVVAASEDLVFRVPACERRVLTLDLPVVDLSGRATHFRLSTSMPGVRLSAMAATTPAVIQVSIDPAAFPQSASGTLAIEAPASVRVGERVRILVHVEEPGQRGLPVTIPGRLVDLLADPERDRFYVLRQDRQEVLAFDSLTFAQLAAIKTGQTPTQMAISFDRRWLLVGNDHSQIASVIDLDTLRASEPIVLPAGHYPRSLASSGRALLAAARGARGKHKIDRVDLATRTATELPALGVWTNEIDLHTILIASPNGGWVLAAQANGAILLYQAAADSFVVSRRDQERLSGAYAASAQDQFVVGNQLLNASGVTIRRFGAAEPAATGFAFGAEGALRLMPSGILERVDPFTGNSARPVRVAEAPPPPGPDTVFSRTVAILANRRGAVTLGSSGVVVLPANYDFGIVPPEIDRVLNSADHRPEVAPGSLISIYGRGLSPVRAANPEAPLPTRLGDSCLAVNGVAVPLIFVSPEQINAQLPENVQGSATLTLRTPNGISNSFPLRIQPTAPSVFLLSVPGLAEPAPAIFNGRNNDLATNSNPVKRGDFLSIFLTGLGLTSPRVAAGAAAPASPPAEPLVAPLVRLGGVEAPVEFARLVPGTVGVYQVQARVPRHAPTGLEVPLEITQGGASTSFYVRVIP